MIKRIYLEITNACNLDCPFCHNNKGQSFMSLDTISNYLTQIKEITDYVYLHVLGEPLLHKDIEKVFDITDNLNLNVQLVTNGTLLKEHLQILKHKSLRKLSISIHSTNNIDIDSTYFNTIDSILNTNNDFYLDLRFVQYEKLDTKTKAYFNNLITKYNVEYKPEIKSYKLKNNIYLNILDEFKWPNINDPILGESGKCKGAVDQIAILHDGRVTICCLDSNGYNEIGNLNKEKLIDIINSNKYQSIINNFKNNKLSFELCKKCSYRLRFK